jgi:Delta3-Delta2-enoyl-CoA isomerase
MNADFWEELLNSLMACEKDKGVRGVVYRSGVKRDVFTAGNDIKELFAPMTNQAQHRRFWRAQTLFLARLYRTPLATIAAIRGVSTNS